MRRLWLLGVLLFLAMLIPAGLTAGAIPRQGDSDEVLVQIPIQSTEELTLIRQLGLPVYARLTGSEGDYLLAGLAGEQSRSLVLPLTVLDDELAGDYYLAATALARVQLDWSAFGRLLLDDGRQVLLRSTPAQVEQLAAAGAQVVRLDMEPIALSDRSPYLLPSTAEYNVDVAGMMGQVVSSTLYTYEERLTGLRSMSIDGAPYTITTRHTASGTPIQQATQWAYEHLADLGLSAEYHYWSGSGYSNRNVVATLQGQSQPDQIFVICAHLDDMPAVGSAPGADDNGSGSAGVLMAADILSQYAWSHTIKFILWTGEEQGLLGAEAWAGWASAQGMDILGVLNMDMIAYNSDASPIIDLHARSWLPDSVALADMFVSVAEVYAIDLTPHVFVDHWLGNYSDNKAFWDEGYAAILTIEDDSDFTPYYHTVGDTLATLDLNYFTESVKAAVGTIAHLILEETTEVYLPLCMRHY